MKKVFTILSLSAVLLFMSNSFAQDRSVASDAWAFGFGFTYPMYVGINDAALNTSEFYGGHIFDSKKLVRAHCLEIKRCI